MYYNTCYSFVLVFSLNAVVVLVDTSIVVFVESAVCDPETTNVKHSSVQAAVITTATRGSKQSPWRRCQRKVSFKWQVNGKKGILSEIKMLRLLQLRFVCFPNEMLFTRIHGYFLSD